MFMKVCVLCVCNLFLSDVYVWSPGIHEAKLEGKAEDPESEICIETNQKHQKHTF